jgi:exopolyphosphatase/guanosine-5'-triphosphate,3'-diphosphate pyrophosphatase
VTTPVRRACIDIGSNTTRLLIAECAGGELHELHQQRVFTRIGAALGADGAIAPSKIAEVAAVVSEQLLVAQSYGVTHVRGVATAAIRRAVNGDQLVGAIADGSGLQVTVLSAEEEARLAFVGAAGTLGRIPDGALGVVDVGGGSSELVVGAAPDTVGWWASFALGSGDLADGFFRSDPPADTEISAARARVAEALDGLDVPQPVEALAVGGSATSLATLAGSRLDADAFKRAFALLASEPASRIAARFSLDLERVRLLPAGLLILEAASRVFGVALAVGRGGIREGVLLEAAPR